MSVPVAVLTGLGLSITVLGLLVGGGAPLIIIGLVRVGFAGLLHVLGTRRMADRPGPALRTSRRLSPRRDRRP
jgi:hypothetical protein